MAAIIFRLILVIIFATAGVAKLVDSSGTRTALANFQLPPVLIPAIFTIIAVIAVMAAFFYLMRSKTPQTVTSQGLSTGTRAPEFALNGYDGKPLSLATLLGRNKPVMLLFASPKCGPCAAMFPEV